MRPRLVAAALVLATGCVGSGEGWLTGSVHVSNCLDGEPFDRQGDFDLYLDFFTGDPVEDASASQAERRNSLTLRLQNATNNLEESNGIVIELHDLGSIVPSILSGAPIPVTNKNLCNTPCPVATDQVRARLFMHASCPDSHDALVASNQEMVGDPQCSLGGGEGLRPTGKELPCPAPDRQTMDALCAGGFNDRSVAGTIDSLLGGSACIYICQLGRAKPGEQLSPEEVAAFRADFGDRVAALVAFNIVDGRAIQYGSCANVAGKVRGMFAFEVARGHSAQTFP